MVQSGEDIPAINGQQPATGGHINGLRGLLAHHWEEAWPINKVSTLSKIVCQPVQPFLPMVFLKLLYQTCWTVAQSPVTNDTDVTGIPEM